MELYNILHSFSGSVENRSRHEKNALKNLSREITLTTPPNSVYDFLQRNSIPAFCLSPLLCLPAMRLNPQKSGVLWN